MPQPIAYNTGSQTSGSIKLFGIEYAISSSIVSGSNNQRWFSSVNPGNGVVFVTSNVTQSFGTYATSVPLFFTASDYSAAAITGAINGLPDRFGQVPFTTTASAYAWVQNSGKYFMMNYEYPQIITDDLVFLVDASLLGSYPTTQSIWYNISGFNNSGSLINSPTFNSAGAIVFDGIDDYAAVGTLPNVSTFCTVNALVRRNPSVATTNGALFGFGTIAGNTQDIYYWANYPGASYQFGFNTWNGDSWGFNNSTASGEVMDGRWHYLTAVFNRNNITGSKIYVDGISKTLSQVFGTTLNRSVSSNFGIAYNGWNTPSQLFNGDISSVEVYGRELSQSEVLQNYYGGPIVTDGLILALDASNLVSYPKLGTTAYSLTGSLTGSLVNGTSFLPNNGGVWDFDGTNDYINTNSTFSSYINASLPISFETWVYINLSNNDEMFMGSSWSNGGVNFRKTGAIYTANKVRFLLFTDGGNGGGLDSSVLTSSGWYHCVGTYNGDGLASSSNFKLYINGKSDGTSAQFGTPTSIPVINNILLGQSGQAGNNVYFTGKMGITRIYNTTLTVEEIAQNFNAQKSRFGL